MKNTTCLCQFHNFVLSKDIDNSLVVEKNNKRTMKFLIKRFKKHKIFN